MPDQFHSMNKRRDDAVRAAWLYFIAGRTQDEIAKQLNVSRQAAQRLVAQAVNERLVNFRIDHPIAACMDLASRLSERFALEFCEVVPTDQAAVDSVSSVAVATAERMNKLLASKTPVILGVGTGRTLRASVEHLDTLDRPQHKILSLVGNMAAGGRASPYEVAMRIADKIGGQRYPLPTPVLTGSAQERDVLQRQRSFETSRELRARANASFVGISEIAWQSPLHNDGFASDEDVSELLRGGAVGEIIGWSFDDNGTVLSSHVNDRVTSLPLASPPTHTTVIVGCGQNKVAPMRAALTGRLGNALVTDERTASRILSDEPEQA